MVYVSDFETFMAEAEDLYRSSPLDTRYNIKYRHCDGKLVLKVTNNRTCLLYKTDQQQDLKKLERITTMFFALFATNELPAEVEDMAAVEHAPAPAAKGKKSSRRKG